MGTQEGQTLPPANTRTFNKCSALKAATKRLTAVVQNMWVSSAVCGPAAAKGSAFFAVSSSPRLMGLRRTMLYGLEISGTPRVEGAL